MDAASEGVTNMATSIATDVTTSNPYEQRATDVAMPIGKCHAIRFLTRNSQEQDLTQEQWEEVCPRIMHALEECTLELGNSVGPGEALQTCNDAMKALECPVVMVGKGTMNPNLSDQDKKHAHAMKWAFGILVKNKVLEPRIKKITGAALTCLIEPPVCLVEAQGKVGVSMVQFPKEEGNQILTECMKAYRVLDTVQRWDLNGFEEDNNDLGKAVEARNYLACCAMIDMQVNPWLGEAKKHLDNVGLGKVEGLLLGEEDILSRLSLLESSTDSGGVVSQCLHAITSKLPLAINNDCMVPQNVGFATAGGKVLAALAPMMFASGQSVKVGCTWQLVGSEHCSVWLSVGTAIVFPFPANVGSALLTAFGECDEGVFPFMVALSTRQMEEMVCLNSSGRLSIRDPHYIPSIDEKGEEY